MRGHYHGWRVMVACMSEAHSVIGQASTFIRTRNASSIQFRAAVSRRACGRTKNIQHASMAQLAVTRASTVNYAREIPRHSGIGDCNPVGNENRFSANSCCALPARDFQFYGRSSDELSNRRPPRRPAPASQRECASSLRSSAIAVAAWIDRGDGGRAGRFHAAYFPRPLRGTLRR